MIACKHPRPVHLTTPAMKAEDAGVVWCSQCGSVMMTLDARQTWRVPNLMHILAPDESAQPPDGEDDGASDIALRPTVPDRTKQP